MAHHSEEFPRGYELAKKLREAGAIGPTGDFPDGSIDETDEGEIQIAVAADEENKLVHLSFGTPVEWMSMKPQQAVEIAQALIKNARKVATEPLRVNLH